MTHDSDAGEQHEFTLDFALDTLDFRPVTIDDGTPTGRKILTAAGIEPTPTCSLYAILPAGAFEDLRLDEPFELRGRGTSRFIAFQTDRVFKFTMNDQQIAWGAPVIGGRDLHVLAQAGDSASVYLELPDGERRPIEPDDTVDLSAPGVERFVRGPKHAPRFLIIVNARAEVVRDKQVTYEQLVQLAFPDVPPDPNVIYSITYRHAASLPHAGELGQGGSVEVKKEGTVFNVTPTVQS